MEKMQAILPDMTLVAKKFSDYRFYAASDEVIQRFIVEFIFYSFVERVCFTQIARTCVKQANRARKRLRLRKNRLKVEMKEGDGSVTQPRHETSDAIHISRLICFRQSSSGT